MHQGNGGGDFSCQQPGLTCLHDGIEIFLRWNVVVNPRYCFVYDFLKTSFFQIDIDSIKYLTGDGCRHFVAGQQSAVCESLMRNKGFIYNFICWQQSTEFSVIENHQGMVMKSVLMIIHIVSVKKKRALPGFCHEVIPVLFLLGCISFDFYHIIF